ncbi:MAG: transketolase [Puniceicoccales bacterium]|jgi:transketolase|nr:transketolase [Puniceicoccales bacterium]
MFSIVTLRRNSNLRKMSDGDVEKILMTAANETRGLAMDAIAAANSGHLGMPMGCAEIGAALFGILLNFDPSHPDWINRDRFILSAGHGSMLLYAWLHLAGYEISMDDIKNFRKSNSKAHGHPEFDKNSGIECTTGPLGQGVANAVGMALSCKKLAVMCNTAEHTIVDNRVVCLCGDGCLQEGISSEACSLAGHWRLDNLIIVFDANGVTLDADLSKSQSEDVPKRFESYGFEIFRSNGNNIRDFVATFRNAELSGSGCPKLIIAETIIGFGIDEVAGTNKAHGAAGIQFSNAAKGKLGLPAEKFFVSDGTKEFFAKKRIERGKRYGEWSETFGEWKTKNPKLAGMLERNGPIIFDDSGTIAESTAEKMSTRVASGKILQKVAKSNKLMLSGSADLFSSACNYIADGGDFSAKNVAGKNIFFGIREHAMAAISNGISYEGLFRICCSTFLVFSDYMRPAMRVAALAKLGTIFVLTHDSIAVGEDGPTHQPVETITSLRCIPNLDVVRPADYCETAGAWELAIANANRPTALILSRQDLSSLEWINSVKKRRGVMLGAYVAREETGNLERIIISSGSELHLALHVASLMHGTRVVSMPCMEAFDRQPKHYAEDVLPKACKKRIAIEAGISMPWHKYVGSDGKVISVDDFGYSGRMSDLLNSFGITLENLKEFAECP